MLKLFRLTILVLSSATVALVGAIVLPACKETAGAVDEVGTFEGGGGSDSGSTGCGSCLTQECLGPSAVCLTDPQCRVLRGCANPFGESAAARDACFCSGAVAGDVAAVTPLAAYRAFASCNDSKTCTACATDCTSSCGRGSPKTTPPTCDVSDAGPGATSGDAAASDGGDAGFAPDAADAGDAQSGAADSGGIPTQVEGCAKCVFDTCVDARKACAVGTECAAYLGCALNCITTQCTVACGQSHATGEASAIELSNCTLTSCRSACGL